MTVNKQPCRRSAQNICACNCTSYLIGAFPPAHSSPWNDETDFSSRGIQPCTSCFICASRVAVRYLCSRWVQTYGFR